MKIKSKILSAFIAGTVAATSFCGVVSAKANGGDIDSLIEAANASNDKFSISVKSTGIPATDVEMQDDGYCALTNFVESISDDSLSAENVSRKRQIALIDTNGEFVFPYENNRIHNYYYLDGVVSKCDNGNYAFSFKNWKDSEWLTDPELGGCEYYTSDGKVLFEHEPYISAKPINDGNAVVYSFKDDSEDSDTTKIWRNVAIINKEGKNVFEQPEQYEYECPIMEGIRGVLYGWCSEGMIPFRSDLVFDDGKITYKEDRDRSDKSCGYMDISGNVVITQKFDNAAPFFGNHAVVRDDGKYGIINKNGEYIIEPQYEHADWVASGISKVCKDGKWGCINMKNEVVVPFEYDDIPEVSFNNENSAIALYTVGKTENDIKKYGIIDGENKNVVPMIFDDLTPVSEEKAFGIYNGEVFSIEIGEKEKTDLSTGKYGVLEYIKIDNDSSFIDRLNNSVSNDGVFDYVMITGSEKDAETVDVPQEIDGLPVKIIGESAFMDNKKLKEVSLPEGLEEIHHQAFSGCTALSSINIPGSVVGINEDVFSNTKILGEISGDIKYIDNWAISSDDDIASANIKKGTVGIAGGAFSMKEKLVSVELSESLKYICANAFSFCNALTDVVILDGVEYIGRRGFHWCENLETVTFGSNLKAISWESFDLCPKLKNVVLPESVRSIGYNAFNNCESLEAITISNKKCDIGNDMAESICNRISPSEQTGETEVVYNGVIYGYANSTAQAYAEKHGYKFKVLKDEPSVTTTVTTTDINSETKATTISGKAEYESPSLVLGDVEGAPGETVTIPVKVFCDNNFESLCAIVKWDDISLKAENVKDVGKATAVIGVNGKGDGYVELVAFGGSALADGAVANITFTIPQNAVLGTVYDLYFGNIETYAIYHGANNGENIASTVPTYGGSITVKEKSAPVTTTSVTTKPSTTTNTTVTTTANTSKTTTTSKATTETTQTSTTTSITTTAPQTTESTETAPVGDANGDNKLNVRDAAFIAAKLAQGKVSELPESADFNGDGKVNVRDAAAIAKFLATGKK